MASACWPIVLFRGGVCCCSCCAGCSDHPADGGMQSGLLAGWPQLARALTRLHEQPGATGV